jgi:hypothetical protein
MNSWGFIITRHVNSENTNKYWNHSVKLIRRLYPYTKIVIIDDNSNQNLVKAEFNYTNVEIIQSEFHGRGELLPYYYYIKHKFFNNAVILHDSVFLHKRINFRALQNEKVIPFWYFNADNEDIFKTLKITEKLKNSYIIQQKLSINDNILGMPINKWYGCFGCQAYINHDFLLQLEQKYNITNLVGAIQNRVDRCCLERILGCIFFTENPNLFRKKALFGDIMKHQKWGNLSFDKYIIQLKNGLLPSHIIKVWTGR